MILKIIITYLLLGTLYIVADRNYLRTLAVNSLVQISGNRVEELEESLECSWNWTRFILMIVFFPHFCLYIFAYTIKITKIS